MVIHPEYSLQIVWQIVCMVTEASKDQCIRNPWYFDYCPQLEASRSLIPLTPIHYVFCFLAEVMGLLPKKKSVRSRTINSLNEL